MSRDHFDFVKLLAGWRRVSVRSGEAGRGDNAANRLEWLGQIGRGQDFVIVPGRAAPDNGLTAAIDGGDRAGGEDFQIIEISVLIGTGAHVKCRKHLD